MNLAGVLEFKKELNSERLQTLINLKAVGIDCGNSKFADVMVPITVLENDTPKSAVLVLQCKLHQKQVGLFSFSTFLTIFFS